MCACCLCDLKQARHLLSADKTGVTSIAHQELPITAVIFRERGSQQENCEFLEFLFQYGLNLSSDKAKSIIESCNVLGSDDVAAYLANTIASQGTESD